MKTLANVLLGAYLILMGLHQLGGVSFPKSSIILAVLAVVTGIVFFFADISEKVSRQLGSILLGAYLVMAGAVSLFHVSFPGSNVVLAAIAVAAGVVVILTRR